MSSWPVITEVCHLVPTTVVPRFLEWIRLGGLHLPELPVTALATIEAWMVRYGNLPMNLADASLLWFAHQSGIRRIATLDQRDFSLYQLPGGEAMVNVVEAIR